MNLLGKYFSMSAHTRLALILAPMLLVGGYIVADYIESRETEKDKVHFLTLSEPCRLGGSACVFRISEFDATLTASPSSGGSRILLLTSEPIKAVNLEMLGSSGNETPTAMTPDSGDLNKWYLDSALTIEQLRGVNMVISTGKVFLPAEARW